MNKSLDEKDTQVLKTRSEIVQAIVAFRDEYSIPRSWSVIAYHFGVSKPCVWRLVNEPDYYPGEKNCEKLGMERSVQVPVCRIHGIAHCYNCETEQVKPKRTARNGHKRRPPRIAIRKDDAESAAKSITRNCNPEFVRELVERLGVPEWY